MTKLKAATILTNGSPTKMAKMLGISQPTASYHLKKSELGNLVSDARKEALKKAGIERINVYKKIKRNLDAKIPQLQTHAIDRSLELLGDKDIPKGEGSTNVVVNMPVVVIDGNPLKFKVGNNNV